MRAPLQFALGSRCRTCGARTGRVLTPHGAFDTPAFMPVGTRAAIKGLTPAQIASTGSQIILANAFHLMLRPGSDVVARLGGLQRFMGWDGPILTDSGGYQAFSMADSNSVDDEGVSFRSIVDGSLVRLDPQRSMEVQNQLGADIIMAFDDCPPSDGGVEAAPAGPSRLSRHRERLERANQRTTRWLSQCWSAHARREEQALFGIVQGGTHLDLRQASLEAVCAIDLPGYAIGGVAVGESPDMIRSVVEFTAPRLPEDRPRYLMGVGYERDLLMAVRAGIDMFDCVLPTRNGRNANAFTRHGRLHLRNACHREDARTLDEVCDCYACAGGFSRAYLRHLFLAGEMLGPILLSLHNVRHFQRLMQDIRRAAADDSWSSLEQAWPVLRLPAGGGAHASRPAAERLQ